MSALPTNKADALDIVASWISDATTLGEVDGWLLLCGIARGVWMQAINESNATIADATVALIQDKAAALRREARAEEERAA